MVSPQQKYLTGLEKVLKALIEYVWENLSKYIYSAFRPLYSLVQYSLIKLGLWHTWYCHKEERNRENKVKNFLLNWNYVCCLCCLIQTLYTTPIFRTAWKIKKMKDVQHSYQSTICSWRLVKRRCTKKDARKCKRK